MASGQPRERRRGRRERKQKMQYECGRGAWIRSPICVMTRLIQRGLCSKFAALRQHGKFPNLKQLMPGLVPGGGTGIYRGEFAPGSGTGRTGMILPRRVRRPGRKLLVLRV